MTSEAKPPQRPGEEEGGEGVEEERSENLSIGVRTARTGVMADGEDCPDFWRVMLPPKALGGGYDCSGSGGGRSICRQEADGALVSSATAVSRLVARRDKARKTKATQHQYQLLEVVAATPVTEAG